MPGKALSLCALWHIFVTFASARTTASHKDEGLASAEALAMDDECFVTGPSSGSSRCALSAVQHQAREAAPSQALGGKRAAAARATRRADASADIPSVVTCAFAQEYSDLCGPSGFKPGVKARGAENVECHACYEECCLANVRLTPDGCCWSCKTESTGVLEVYHEGEWGTVCSNDFGNADADVVCRQLGYRRGRGRARAFIPSEEAPGKQCREPKPIWLDGVNCTGSEAQLVDCPSSRWAVSRCSHSMDVFVNCHP